MSPQCTVYKGYCAVHDFTHGAEAEELRSGIELILHEDLRTGREFRTVLSALLDKVDARDSLAFIEAQKEQDKEDQDGEG